MAENPSKDRGVSWVVGASPTWAPHVPLKQELCCVVLWCIVLPCLLSCTHVCYIMYIRNIHTCTYMYVPMIFQPVYYNVVYTVSRG